MSKRKAPLHDDEDESNTHEKSEAHLLETHDGNSLAFSAKHKRFSNINDLTKIGDLLISRSSASNCRREQRCGTIESVSLKNFKCHAYFNFEFGSNINFFTGRNGSEYFLVLFIKHLVNTLKTKSIFD